MQANMPPEMDDRTCVEASEALWSALDRRVPSDVDPPLMFKRSPSTQQQLSREQRRFAEEHEATPGMHAGERRQLVYFYRYQDASTHRWLVDPDGAIVDFVSLR
jgi:hypothetical protein